MITIRGIDCHGEMYKEQNINVICEEEMWNGIYPNGFDTWENAVDQLEIYYPGIVGLEAI